MAIVKCKVCGEEIEETILKCPRCDSLGPKRGKRIRLILLCVMVVIVAFFGLGYYLQMDEVEKPYEEVLREKLDDKLSQRGLTAMLLLRSRLGNPESMKLEKSISNEDGSVLCFEFTETDAAGVTKKSRAAFVDGELDRTPAGWKLFCVGKSMRPITVKADTF